MSSTPPPAEPRATPRGLWTPKARPAAWIAGTGRLTGPLLARMLLATTLLGTMILATPLARAEDDARAVELGARLEGALPVGQGPAGPGFGFALGADAPLGRVASVGMEFVSGLDRAAAPRVSGFAGARFRVAAGLWLSAAVGGGLRTGGPVPLGRAGLGYDVGLGNGGAVRLAVLGELAPAGAELVVGLGLQMGRTRRDPPPVPVARATAPVAASVEPAAPVEPDAPSFDVKPVFDVYPPDALVWVPHPVCAWVPADQVAPLLAIVDPALPLQVRAPGYLPQDVPQDGVSTVTLRRAPGSGGVVLAAFPGDRVTIGETVFPLGPDGTAVFGAPEGPVRVTVTGGGRSTVLEGAVAGGYTLWLRAPTPTPLVVSFPPGSSVVPPDAMQSIMTYAAAAGEHGFRVVGSHSGESDAGESRRLAVARAEALSAALVAAGVPAEHVDVLSTSAPEPGAPPAALRVARVEPMLPPDAP